MPLLWCDQYGMNIPVDMLWRRIKTVRCYRVTEIHLQWRDVKLVQILGNCSLACTGGKGSVGVGGGSVQIRGTNPRPNR